MSNDHWQQVRETLAVLTSLEGVARRNYLKPLKHKAQKEGLNIFTLGIGTQEGAPIPLFDEHGKQIGHQQDEQGNVVISRLNEHMLRTLSSDMKGAYIRLTKNDADLKKLITYIQKFEQEHFEDKTLESIEDKYT